MEWFERQWEKLNEYQRAAVVNDSPACLVNACVGSGKTTVLVTKILYLHKVKQVPYRNMVVLTFTNKAADEIAERLIAAEPDLNEEELKYFGTFHSVAMRMLEEELPLEQSGRSRGFTILLPEEEQELALQIAAERKLTVKYKNRLKKRMEQEYDAFRNGRSENGYGDDLVAVFEALEVCKCEQNQMTYADLLIYAAQLLQTEEGKTVCPEWIIIDEVQDSDKRQMEFLTALKRESTRLFAVGDPNQLIYGWRGSMETIFYALKQRFDAEELSLPVNYRSNSMILAAAKRFQQFSAPLTGAREEGAKIRISNHYDPFQEALYLQNRIQELADQGIPASEIGIFCRLTEQVEYLLKILGENCGAQILTLHASKGLEFSHIFLTGVNDGLLPLAGCGEDGMEEERRLFFVGMTRAKNFLEISYYTNPGRARVRSGPGMFVRMIPSDLTDKKETGSQTEKRDNLQKLRKEVAQAIARKEADESRQVEQQEMQQEKQQEKQSDLQKELLARHRKYGTGRVTMEDDMMIEVEFENYGTKQFLKAFGEVELL